MTAAGIPGVPRESETRGEWEKSPRTTAAKLRCAEGRGKGLLRVRGIIHLGGVPAKSQKRLRIRVSDDARGLWG